ncbi:MAG: glycosyltransferase family 4 protein [Chlorobiaceae bacterium]|nr:glycosyltransferase family 4 protein [Chlorobiaceae bacterium]
MIRKVAIVHTDFRIYWPARLKSLSDFLAEKGVVLSVIEISGKGSPYDFAGSSTQGNERWRCLFQDQEMENISSEAAVEAVMSMLDEIQPDVVIAGAIAFPSGAAAARWGVKRRKPVVLFDDARLEDVPRSPVVNWVKKSIYRTVRAMVIPAPSHDETYRFYGFSQDQLHYGVNCIDNRAFSRSTAPTSPEVPESVVAGRFFLAVGRQIEKKNWLSLLRAFRQVAGRPELQGWTLVFIGDGPDHAKLKTEAGDLDGNRVVFLPFMNQEALRGYYAAAGALVLPSLHGETWGLVVNEAMAAGLPVLVSEKCGSSRTLVRDGENGFVFNPDDQGEIGDSIAKFAGLSPEKRAGMGSASEKIIADWGLERFCSGMWNACLFADAHRNRRGSLAGRVIVRYWNGRYRPT